MDDESLFNLFLVDTNVQLTEAFIESHNDEYFTVHGHNMLKILREIRSLRENNKILLESV